MNEIQDTWKDLSLRDKADIIKVAINNGITKLSDIRDTYNKFAEGGDTNDGMTGMMKSKLALASHFGNPTARRMTNYDTRSYTFKPGEISKEGGEKGNVYVEASSENLVTPQIQLNNKGNLEFVPKDKLWDTEEHDQRSYLQSLKFDNEEDAKYFGEHYKEIAPMMNLYDNGGSIYIKPSHKGRFTELKERTGHSTSWFLENGTPEQKKMANFARNASHWNHHSEGGNLFLSGGDTFESDKVLGRANRVYTNYEDAKDFDINPIAYGIRDWMYENGIPHSGLSNCTLTASQWIDPNNPIKSADTIVTNPGINGYKAITKEEIAPGDLMISKNPKTGSYHTMLIESINKDGTPNLRYSTGGPNNDSLRFGISQKEYHNSDNKQGGKHTKDMFFRYNYPNEIWLPQVNVTAPRRYYEGGNLFLDGGYTPSDSIKSSIAGYEGKAMTQSTIDPLSHKKVAKNASFESEAKGFTNALPEDIKDKVLSNPELADWLYHYSYNVGAGNFKDRVVPSLRNYFNGKATIDDVTKSMWASGDSKLRGLQRRRTEEKNGVKNALLGIHIDPTQYAISDDYFDKFNNSLYLPTLPQVSTSEDVDPALAYKAPIIDSTLFKTPQSIVEEESIYNPREEKLERLNAINNVFAMMGEESPLVEILNPINSLMNYS